jgi:hypothetical protein
MTTPQDLPADEAELRAWDWRTELREQDRTLLWLARRSEVHYQTVYRIARGEQTPTVVQLRAFSDVLLGRVPA